MHTLPVFSVTYFPESKDKEGTSPKSLILKAQSTERSQLRVHGRRRLQLRVHGLVSWLRGARHGRITASSLRPVGVRRVAVSRSANIGLKQIRDKGNRNIEFIVLEVR
jgi:hypothetical protein